MHPFLTYKFQARQAFSSALALLLILYYSFIIRRLQNVFLVRGSVSIQEKKFFFLFPMKSVFITALPARVHSQKYFFVVISLIVTLYNHTEQDVFKGCRPGCAFWFSCERGHISCILTSGKGHLSQQQLLKFAKHLHKAKWHKFGCHTVPDSRLLSFVNIRKQEE